jgi:hypothetical protein
MEYTVPIGDMKHGEIPPTTDSVIPVNLKWKVGTQFVYQNTFFVANLSLLVTWYVTHSFTLADDATSFLPSACLYIDEYSLDV